MSGTLFFDQLLNGGGINATDTLYPPEDIDSLRQLLDAVEGASYDSMKRDCLVYYLLKEHGDKRELRYADVKCISPQYSSLADAYWHLDTGVNLGVRATRYNMGTRATNRATESHSSPFRCSNCEREHV